MTRNTLYANSGHLQQSVQSTPAQMAAHQATSQPPTKVVKPNVIRMVSLLLSVSIVSDQAIKICFLILDFNSTCWNNILIRHFFVSRLCRILLIRNPRTSLAVRVCLVSMRARDETHLAIIQRRSMPRMLSCSRASCGRSLRLWTRSLRRELSCWGWFMGPNLSHWQVIVRGLPRKPSQTMRESSTR